MVEPLFESRLHLSAEKGALHRNGVLSLCNLGQTLGKPPADNFSTCVGDSGGRRAGQNGLSLKVDPDIFND